MLLDMVAAGVHGSGEWGMPTTCWQLLWAGDWAVSPEFAVNEHAPSGRSWKKYMAGEHMCIILPAFTTFPYTWQGSNWCLSCNTWSAC